MLISPSDFSANLSLNSKAHSCCTLPSISSNAIFQLYLAASALSVDARPKTIINTNDKIVIFATALIINSSHFIFVVILLCYFLTYLEVKLLLQHLLY